ncbi:nuclear transport factor 2 family protein [Streptomyces avicenniae]|uniref:nuclear transport factor 2 family protein n=1 Tax=Streptomyces avicenniae TaxID=500153 RepID=UPI00069BACD7|nr:nuclear transport factor 2 family protein [Streptomyces avicenniae]
MSTDTLPADRAEIADLLTRLARLIDEKRWDDAGTVYADDIAVHSPRGGELRGLDEVVAFMKRAEVAGEHTQHVTTDLLVEVQGDHASAAANSLVFFHRDGQAPHLTSGLRLDSALTRTPAGWRISEWRITLAWTRAG